MAPKTMYSPMLTHHIGFSLLIYYYVATQYMPCHNCLIPSHFCHRGSYRLWSDIQVSKYPLEWQVTYEAVDEAGNYAEPKVRTIEIQASGKGRCRRHACFRDFGLLSFPHFGKFGLLGFRTFSFLLGCWAFRLLCLLRLWDFGSFELLWFWAFVLLNVRAFFGLVPATPAGMAVWYFLRDWRCDDILCRLHGVPGVATIY